MHGTCKSFRFDIMGLKRPTSLDKLIESIPKPPGAIPEFGLPKWKVMPLESKIPMVPGPEDAYNFTRQKLGKSMWVGSKHAEFNLNDPYGYELKLSYDSLHDEHLTPFFAKQHNIRRLLDAGLITRDMSVKCSLRDYNVYRKFLRKLQCDRIRSELRKKASAFDEKRRKSPPHKAQIEASMLRRKEKVEAVKKARERMMQEREEKIKQVQEKDERINERLREQEVEKENRLRLLYENKSVRYEQFRQKVRLAMYLQRLRVVRTLAKWKRREQKRLKQMELRAQTMKEEKEKALEDKWIRRLDFQQEQIEKESFLLQCIEDEHHKFLKDYNEKVEKERARMKKLFEKSKMFIACLLARQVAGGKNRICCKAAKGDDELSPEEARRRLLCDYRAQITDIQRKFESSMSQQGPMAKGKGETHGKHEKLEKLGKHRKRGKLEKRGKKGKYGKQAKRKRGKKKRSKRRKKQSEAKESGTIDAESQLDRAPSFESALRSRQKSEAAETSTVIRDKCRCEMIKAQN